MKFNIQAIKTNSRKVYDILLRYTHCTFGELEKRCNLASTDLCMAFVKRKSSRSVKTKASITVWRWPPLDAPEEGKTRGRDGSVSQTGAGGAEVVGGLQEAAPAGAEPVALSFCLLPGGACFSAENRLSLYATD